MPTRSNEARPRVTLLFTVVFLHVVSIYAPIFACRHVDGANHNAEKMNAVARKNLDEMTKRLPRGLSRTQYTDRPIAMRRDLDRIRNGQHRRVINQHKIKPFPGLLQYLYNLSRLQKL